MPYIEFVIVCIIIIHALYIVYNYNEPVTRKSINLIVPSVNHFSCSNFDKRKLSENYLDNLNKIKNIIYYLHKKISR